MDFSINDVWIWLQLLLDILAVSTVLYSGLRIIRNNSRTIQIFKGILVVILIKLLALALGLHALNWLIDTFLNWGVVAVLILFQPEIRSMLEKVGKTTAIFSQNVSVSQISGMVDELVESCSAMSRTKTGALITIQMTQSLQDYIETGITMDAEVSSELLGTIFQYGTPMHDGAVIIQGVKIACAAAYFPPTARDLPDLRNHGLHHHHRIRRNRSDFRRHARTADAVQPGCTAPLSDEQAGSTGRRGGIQHGACSEYSPEGGVQHSQAGSASGKTQG